MTLRAVRLLKELSYFLCEDTRTAKKLFAMYDIDCKGKQFFALTSFTDKGKMNRYKNLVAEQEVGMISEAGTPGLSDPGKSLIQLCNEELLSYTILPGANALVPAVVGAGFDTSIFTFIGFLPQKKGRQTALKEAMMREHPTFFYESVHRMEKLIGELRELGFGGKMSIAREVSKMFEQFWTGSLEDLEGMLRDGRMLMKGEFVVGLRN
ncbi:MAG: 16S rRNA (cytidine(1402)-2'-O)-methyltransferase [Candidatus Peribacteria bacterium]|nr:16S rRNA (cytidine(1402)-2'-O)-methyltransferase [Candidatus Peribacteria bacterium]